MAERRLIVNADDLGYAPGVGRGIALAHERGIVTSASLMVTTPAAAAGAAVAGAHPRLSVGLHWDVTSSYARAVDLDDPRAVRGEVARQLRAFERLVGRPPTHVDSHHHAHRAPGVFEAVREEVAPLGVPVRGDGAVRLVLDFHARPERGATDLDRVGASALERLLVERVGDGWTELCCHPGLVDAGLRSSYRHEREAELAALTDPAVRATVDRLGIRLASFADYSTTSP